MRLIDADELELDTEWSDYYDGFTSYSQSQINEAEEIKAIPLEKVKQAIEEIEQYLLEEECNGNHEKGILFVLEILERNGVCKRNIGESKGGYAPDTNVGSKKGQDMTKEEAIKQLKENRLLCINSETEPFAIAYDMAIKALEQEPCEDAVSRKKIEKLKRWRFPYDTKTTIPKSDLFVKLTDIRALSSVKSTQGWIPVSERLPKPYTFVNATCRSLVDDRENWVVETIYLPIPKEVNEQGYSDWGNIPILNWGKAEVIAWMRRDIPKPYKAEMEGD